jgi:hypothetical protein
MVSEKDAATFYGKKVILQAKASISGKDSQKSGTDTICQRRDGFCQKAEEI